MGRSCAGSAASFCVVGYKLVKSIFSFQNRLIKVDSGLLTSSCTPVPRRWTGICLIRPQTLFIHYAFPSPLVHVLQIVRLYWRLWQQHSVVTVRLERILFRTTRATRATLSGQHPFAFVCIELVTVACILWIPVGVLIITAVLIRVLRIYGILSADECTHAQRSIQPLAH